MGARHTYSGLIALNGFNLAGGMEEWKLNKLELRMHTHSQSTKLLNEENSHEMSTTCQKLCWFLFIKAVRVKEAICEWIVFRSWH